MFPQRTIVVTVCKGNDAAWSLLRQTRLGRSVHSRQAEIRQFHRPVVQEETVVGLQIPVEYPSIVTRRDSSQQRQQVPLRIGQRDGYGPVLQYLLQVGIGAFVHQTHGHVGGGEHVHELDDVFVLELSQQFDFPNGGEVDPLPIIGTSLIAIQGSCGLVSVLWDAPQHMLRAVY